MAISRYPATVTMPGAEKPYPSVLAFLTLRFPQIEPGQHLEEMGGEPGPRACFDCHEPHSPL